MRMPPSGVIRNEELDAEETQDEILARGGDHDLALPSAVAWKILVVFGVVATILGILFWYGIQGISSRPPTISESPSGRPSPSFSWFSE